jgi:hypothetical protein
VGLGRVKEGWHSSILTWLHCLCTIYCVCCCWQCAALPPDEDHLWRNSSMMSSWHPPDPRDTSAIVVSEPTVRFVQVWAGDVVVGILIVPRLKPHIHE